MCSTLIRSDFSLCGFGDANRMITIVLLAVLAVLVTGFILIVFLRVFNKINTKQCDCPVDLNFKDKVSFSSESLLSLLSDWTIAILWTISLDSLSGLSL